jgi:hypothetical protein
VADAAVLLRIHATAPLPNSVMKSRRLMLTMGLGPSRAERRALQVMIPASEPLAQAICRTFEPAGGRVTQSLGRT